MTHYFGCEPGEGSSVHTLGASCMLTLKAFDSGVNMAALNREGANIQSYIRYQMCTEVMDFTLGCLAAFCLTLWLA